ncbi:serine dehydratase subunit alpha family protein [Priestia taiwanensis]|uniref:UPF0597 protein GCM10007140_30720 n=1 Tax=Priestia taiwanensis TaxID=1347902 RepID=A0A917ERV8_9BACI|nr:L-serine ammonia-lyase, iron-sulfur-dependent, subunit alpha [Priestia taiwanensis]MBM7364708.1 L-cysteine desulfidase [Priestia taiwanensis]GGE79019.1 UPF0597 protein [Priestia taiwanensis]
MQQEKILQVLEKELVVALGCTEPVSIALAAATAREHIAGDVKSIEVLASANIIKNAMAVGIPGMQATGIDFVSALGALAGKAKRKLEVLEGVTLEDEQRALDLVGTGNVTVDLADTPKKLYIEVKITTTEGYAKAIIQDNHTFIALVEVNGEMVYKNGCGNTHFASSVEERDVLTIPEIYEFVTTVDVAELDLVKRSIELNRTVALDGLKNEYGLQVGKTLKENVAKGILSDDLTTHAMALAAAGSDARMAGSTLPVMANSGSGNQGIAVTMPVVAAGEKLHVSEEQLIRAVTLSHLLAIFVKNQFGRLSALCGVTVAGASASAAITYLLGGDLEKVKYAIQNTLGNVTGMLCDGAKAGCAMKVATCSSAAVQSALLASQGMCISATDGFIEEDVEKTIENFCRLGNEGSPNMDKIMLEMMVNKRK